MVRVNENYSRINAEVAAMGDVIQYVPATPAFDDEAAEEAALLQTALADEFFVWDDAFMRGTKDIDADWAEYEAELKDKGIDDFVALYLHQDVGVANPFQLVGALCIEAAIVIGSVLGGEEFLVLGLCR